MWCDEAQFLCKHCSLYKWRKKSQIFWIGESTKHPNEASKLQSTQMSKLLKRPSHFKLARVHCSTNFWEGDEIMCAILELSTPTTPFKEEITTNLVQSVENFSRVLREVLSRAGACRSFATVKQRIICWCCTCSKTQIFIWSLTWPLLGVPR